MIPSAVKTDETCGRSLSYRTLRNHEKKKHHRVPSHFKLEPLDVHLEKQVELRSGQSSAAKKLLPDSKPWPIASEGFPPGVTVDELKKYVRRRQLSHLKPQDNLHLEEGSLKPYKSEYKRRFQGYDTSALERNPGKPFNETNHLSYEDLFFFLPEYRLSYVNYPRKRPVLKKPKNHLEPLKGLPMEATTENHSQYVAYPHYERRKLLRRSTALKPEGDVTNETEVRKEYRYYANPERVQLVRRLPSLKPEGNFESLTSEQHDQFIAYLLSKRPPLEKRRTLLKMEGDFDFSTEQHDSYPPYEPFQRPHLRKRSTSLKLDGELEFFPEYRNSYVDFSRTRPITFRPNSSLRYEGDLANLTETQTQFVNFENIQAPEKVKPENNLHIEGKMEVIPEYKINYVDFPRERPLVRKPLNQLNPDGNLRVLTGNAEKPTEGHDPNKPGSSQLHLLKPNEISKLSPEDGSLDKTPQKTESSETNLQPKPTTETSFQTKKYDKFGFEISDKAISEKKSTNFKLGEEYLFTPEYKRPYRDFSRPHLLKPIQSAKSVPASPRRKPKDKIRFSLENETKYFTDSPVRLPKKINERTLEQLDKSLKHDLPKDNFFKPDLDLISLEKLRPSETPKLETYLRDIGSPEYPLGHKDFEAFKVLDVKGQLGCQSMKKDIVEEGPTYRLEVTHPENTKLQKRDLRISPNFRVTEEAREEAEIRARRRAENYVKTVKSPEIPKYLLEENNNEIENRWKSPGKLSPLFPMENSHKSPFLLLNGKHGMEAMRFSGKREKGDWSSSDWISSES